MTLDSALGRSLDLYNKEPQLFEKLAKPGMRYDYFWRKPGDDYEAIYENIRHP